MGECGIGHAKMAEPIKLPFGLVSGVGPKNHLFDGTYIGATWVNTVANGMASSQITLGSLIYVLFCTYHRLRVYLAIRHVGNRFACRRTR